MQCKIIMADDDSLPLGWLKCKSRRFNNYFYYYNCENKVSQWERPESPKTRITKDLSTGLRSPKIATLLKFPSDSICFCKSPDKRPISNSLRIKRKLEVDADEAEKSFKLKHFIDTPFDVPSKQLKESNFNHPTNKIVNIPNKIKTYLENKSLKRDSFNKHFVKDKNLKEVNSSKNLPVKLPFYTLQRSIRKLSPNIVCAPHNVQFIESAAVQKIPLVTESQQGINCFQQNIKSTDRSIKEILEITPPVYKNIVDKNSIFLILDTNILLSELNMVKKLLVQYKGKLDLVLYLPWVVVVELDILKESKINKTSLCLNARSAIQFIRDCLTSKITKFQTQSISQDSEKFKQLNLETNDDRILKSAMQLKEKDPNSSVIVLSNDKNLLNKVMMAQIGIIACDNKEIIVELNLLSQHPNIYTNRGPDQTSDTGFASPPKAIHPNPTFHNKNGEKKQNNNDFNSEVNSYKIEESYDKNNDNLQSLSNEDTFIIWKIIENLLCDTLSTILRKEMISAYDNLWLKIIAHPPPWTISDAIHCIQKHWIAVFTEFLSKQTKMTITELEKEINKDLKSLSQLELIVVLTLQIIECFKCRPYYKFDVESFVAKFKNWNSILKYGTFFELKKCLKLYKQITQKNEVLDSKIVNSSDKKLETDCIKSKVDLKPQYHSKSEKTVLKCEIRNIERVDDPEAIKTRVIEFFNIIWKAINCYCGSLAKEFELDYKEDFEDLDPSVTALHLLKFLPQFLLKTREIYKLYKRLLSLSSIELYKNIKLFDDFLNILKSFLPSLEIECFYPVPCISPQMLYQTWAIDENKNLFFYGFRQLVYFISILDLIQTFRSSL